MRPYVVRQGDYLTQIAHRRGFSAEVVWNDPLNDALRQKRASPDILQPGDILHLPDAHEGWNPLPLAAGGENRFAARIPTIEIKLMLKHGDRSPIANKPFRVEGMGPEPYNGTTDSTGLASFPVPVHVHEVDLSLDEVGLYYYVRVGHLDPADEPSGAAKRLAHLGYLTPIDMNKMVPSAHLLSEAIAAFQEAKGIKVTGALDDTTHDALVEAHGS